MQKKYKRLFDYFKSCDKDDFVLTFAEIEEIIGDRLPASSYLYHANWSNNDHEALSASWLPNGYMSYGVNLKTKVAHFKRGIPNLNGPRNTVRSDEKVWNPTIKDEQGYSLIDIQIDEIFETEYNGNGVSHRVVYNPETEEQKRIVGKKGEKIAFEYLNRHRVDLNIKEIVCWSDGENRDDGKGFDISYITNDGDEYFVEVKTTSQNLLGRVCFEMSANEYAVMKAHEDRYYVFFINDVNNEKEIKRILGKDIYGAQPIKYRIDFESIPKKG